MSVSLDDIVRKSDGPIEADTGSEILLMTVQSGRYFSMDGVAKGIWLLINGLTPVRQIIEKQLENFEVDRQVCEDETLSFLNDLFEKKLIERVEGIRV